MITGPRRAVFLGLRRDRIDPLLGRRDLRRCIEHRKSGRV
jgi:hypothetical protein